MVAPNVPIIYWTARHHPIDSYLSDYNPPGGNVRNYRSYNLLMVIISTLHFNFYRFRTYFSKKMFGLFSGSPKSSSLFNKFLDTIGSHSHISEQSNRSEVHKFNDRRIAAEWGDVVHSQLGDPLLFDLKPFGPNLNA